ncbi:cytochrome-c peroxidase protein (plasmid) [Rhizobium etli 8C-3]|uniref:Cytochrome-c peroxidase protein n=2 Tax=Rhizobium etli TaxID=29449 RepID=A0A1L5PA95_RHIET|nr:cytochrome-c peroxidase protein [Rhizobium etli 8C-3]
MLRLLSSPDKAILCLAAGIAFTAFVAVANELSPHEPITPVPLETKLDQHKVALGGKLFNDSRLSAGNGLACSSCHLTHLGMADGLALSRGVPGNPGVLNTPTLFNVGLNSKYTWSGRLLSLEQQAHSVVESKTAMATRWEEVLNRLKNDSSLVAEFATIYPGGIQQDSVVDALANFQRSLNTPNAPFDRYLRGEADAISPEAKAGYKMFKDFGCISCHQGVNIGGNMLQIFGIFGKPTSAAQGDSTPGAAPESGISDDRPVFRVPSLRNIAHTAPYFHDGSAQTLEEAIGVMASHQLGRTLTADDTGKLAEFLRTLTGEYQGTSLDDR